MIVKTIVLGLLGTNSYVLYDENTKDAVLVDPSDDEQGLLNRFIEENSLNLRGILITHAHYDHIGSVDRLRDLYNVKVFTSQEESEDMQDPNANLSMAFGYCKQTKGADEFVKEHQVLEFGNIKLKCIEVPGHSRNSICYYDEVNNILFSGDTMFRGTIGRTDFYNGPSNTLTNMIDTKLLILPGDTKIYPGHGFATTLDTEKTNFDIFYEE